MASWRQAANAMHDLLAPAYVALGTPSTKVFVGWPDPNTIQADLSQSQGKALVSIFPNAGSRLSSRYNREPAIVKHNATETVTALTNTVTLGGALQVGDNIFVFLNGKAFGVNVGASDTLVTLAAALAIAISAGGQGLSATSTGATVTITPSSSIFNFSAAAFGYGDVLVEVSRITRRMMVSIWASKPDDREALSDATIQTLANAEFLSYADGSLGRILFDGDIVSDAAMQLCIAKNDQFWAVEYPVFVTSKAARVGDIELSLMPMAASAMQAVINADIGSVIVISGPTGQGQIRLLDEGNLVGIVDTINVIGSAVQATAVGTDGTITVTAASVGSAHSHVWHEIPSGAKPGFIFTLSQPPTVGGEVVFVNGRELARVASSPGIGEYSISGTTITIGGPIPLQPNDFIEVHYQL